ncbi:SOS response-associated peptidase [Halarchaeum sp. CBA1220]|uniref:SOS response-associated peptidase n=1 Tax=Halarchaeum sp. CBA1220 TaxID=1853682 RepID=UPI000F3A82D5|nr:SOS response-associated peptidase [Halarchaeum sp. CBA1220]QLC34016.1 SOS response-associated peptidase [Halarchaeum sp. CBA1220]
MCGRYALFSDSETLAHRFDVTVAEYEPTYNAAPSQSLPVVTNDDPGVLQSFQWGLVPPWADDADPGPINARVETAHEKPTFAESVETRRCLVPCGGFYEWREEGGTNQPYFFARADGAPFAMAGIWARYEPETKQTGLGEFADAGEPDQEADAVHSFAILTTEASGVVADYHHRESVVLSRAEEARWLDGDLDVREHENALDVTARPVSRAVNDPANDRPALVERV